MYKDFRRHWRNYIKVKAVGAVYSNLTDVSIFSSKKIVIPLWISQVLSACSPTTIQTRQMITLCIQQSAKEINRKGIGEEHLKVGSDRRQDNQKDIDQKVYIESLCRQSRIAQLLQINMILWQWLSQSINKSSLTLKQHWIYRNYVQR